MAVLFRILFLLGVLSLVVGTNETSGHGLGNETETEHKEHKEHASIHLATIKFDYVKQPLIIAVFIFAAGIAKLGKGYITKYVYLYMYGGVCLCFLHCFSTITVTCT